jgi:Cdc6-like AAA superfamily ATPase
MLTVWFYRVRSLSIVLQDIEVVLLERELISQQKAELHDIIEGCRHVLHDLDKKLSKYGELKLDSESVGQRMKRAWKRLKWEPEDIRELRSRINSNITLLNAFNGRLTRDNVVKLIRHQDNQERRNILDWLAKVDYASQHIDFIGRRQEGTGQWLLGSNEFQAWLNANNQILFCPGIPGAGKTILAATVVDYLCTKFQNEASVGIAYIYCNFRSQEKQRSADLLTSLLRQLVQGQPSVPDDVKNLYERHKDKPRPPPDDVSKILHAVMSDYSRTFIIIDALDECQISDDSRNQFLSEIFNLRTKTGANIFATSRFIPEIMKRFEGCVSLEIRASIDDVERYLDGHILRLPLCVSRSYALQENIKAEITKAVDGMYVVFYPVSSWSAQLRLTQVPPCATPSGVTD